METTSRQNFVNNANAKMFVYNKFIETLNELKNSELVKKYDGKTINKRFTDKINPTLPKGMQIEIKSESYTDMLNIVMYFDRYGHNSEGLNAISDPILQKSVRDLSYDICTEKIIQYKPNIYDPTDGTYLLTNRIFKYDQFIHSVNKTIANLQQWLNDLQRSVDEVEITYQKYVELAKHVKEVMDSIPSPLRRYINIQNPLY